jgi:hypothetical protein
MNKINPVDTEPMSNSQSLGEWQSVYPSCRRTLPLTQLSAIMTGYFQVVSPTIAVIGAMGCPIWTAEDVYCVEYLGHFQV